MAGEPANGVMPEFRRTVKVVWLRAKLHAGMDPEGKIVVMIDSQNMAYVEPQYLKREREGEFFCGEQVHIHGLPAEVRGEQNGKICVQTSTWLLRVDPQYLLRG